MLQPQDRPAGSAQVLRFVGTVFAGVPLATFPKDNGEMTTGGAPTAVRGLRFLLADATDLTDVERRFDAYVYDDAQPAGVSPHSPVPTAAVPLVVNANELDIGLRTWVQNLDVSIAGLTPGLPTSVDIENCVMVLDTLTSGLGTNTGLPVLIIPIATTDDGDGGLTAFPIDVRLEVRWSAHR